MNAVVVVFVVWFAVVLGGGIWWATRTPQHAPLVDRGVGPEIQAFVGEAVEGIEHAGLRDALIDRVVDWLKARE